jgi:hypothetical protein
MADIPEKIFKYALGKHRNVKNSLWIAACFLLIGVNVCFFLFFPHLLSSVAIVLSNVITLILTFLAFKPLNSWLQGSLMERQQALIEKMEKDRELEKKVEVLEQENRTLSDKLDTRVQTGAFPVHIDYTFKVEQMEYAKQGYVVKEEEVDALDREQFNIPDRKFFETILEDSLLKEASIRKILYIHKFYYKVTLGIDFSKIMYALADGKVLFNGVQFRKLHDVTSELEPEHEDIDRVEILKISGDKTEIRQDKEYEPLKEQYRNVRAQEVKTGMEEEVTALCGQYTLALQDSIRNRFPDRVDFVDSIEDHRDKNWYALKGSTDPMVHEIAGTLLLLTTVMNKTQAIGEQAGGHLLAE